MLSTSMSWRVHGESVSETELHEGCTEAARLFLKSGMFERGEQGSGMVEFKVKFGVAHSATPSVAEPVLRR